MEATEIIRMIEGGKSIKYLSPSSLEAALPELDARGYYVHVLEAHEKRGEWEVPILWLSLIGVDGDENWENHHDAKRNLLLVLNKIRQAKESGLNIVYEAWVGKLE